MPSKIEALEGESSEERKEASRLYLDADCYKYTHTAQVKVNLKMNELPPWVQSHCASPSTKHSTQIFRTNNVLNVEWRQRDGPCLGEVIRVRSATSSC
jgi:hypothetical protein